MVKYTALRYIVWPMKKIASLILALGLSLQVSHASFGPTPSKIFNPGGPLSCESIEKCTVPSYRTLQKITEDFIAFSVERVSVIDIMETKIQAGSQTYEHHLESTFSALGNTNFKTFLESGKNDFDGLLDKLGLSSARQLVSGNSPFIAEMKSLQVLLKKADANIKNSTSKEEQKAALLEKQKRYFEFRTNGSFTSYKHIDQVKTLVDYYLQDQSLEPWITTKEKNLRLSFNDCPVKIRRAIRKKRPSIKINSELKQLKFDVFNHPEFVSTLVENGRLLKINCRKKTTGTLVLDIDQKNGAVNIDYQLSHNKTPILPLK
ncbi:MAG: hypothetical protein ACJAT2_003677 [Bacteriovoracaceae bacterium]|jgi:hypothetical protein